MLRVGVQRVPRPQQVRKLQRVPKLQQVVPRAGAQRVPKVRRVARAGVEAGVGAGALQLTHPRPARRT